MRGASWRGLTAVLAVLFMAFLWRDGRAEAPPVATVETATGPLSVTRGHGPQPIAISMRAALYAGDVVRTGSGSKATLLFSDGSQVRLGPNSSIVVSPPEVVKGNSSLFRAIFGQIWARLRPGQAVQTQYSNLLVRGTEIDLVVGDDGTTTLTVVEGSVEFFNQLGDVLVNQDQQSVVHPGAAPTVPITIGNAEFLIEWTLDLDRSLLPREKFYIGLDQSPLAPELARRSVAAGTHPNDPQARLDFGDALFDSRRYDEALAAYLAADKLAPNQPATLTRAGYALLELGQLDDAEARFNAANAAYAANSLQTARPAQALLPDSRRLATRPAAALQLVGSRPNGGAPSPTNHPYVLADAEIAPRPGDYAPALTGLAWCALERNHPMLAGQLAQQAAAADPKSLEARLVLGLSWLRQPGHLDEAAHAFEAAANGEPAAQRYQAHTWLAMTALAQNDSITAKREAALAAHLAPDSALAQANLATVEFFSGDQNAAHRAALAAVHLNPDLVAAQVALGQAELAQGSVNAAARTAARAVALDPRLPQAQYLLGVADAQRRDYTHAERELKRAVALEPDFAPAVAALARVDVLAGHETEATTYLASLPPALRNDPEVVTAYGEALYRSGHYKQALAQLEGALHGGPGGAQFYATLARVAMDSNHLNDAIVYGQKAVELAPTVGQYHAILGLAYTYCKFTVLAAQEFNYALAYDPDNALALVEQGQLSQSGDPRLQQRTLSTSEAQGFIEDPQISRDILRPGKKFEVDASAYKDFSDLGIQDREDALDGHLNFYGDYVNDQLKNGRPNSDYKIETAEQDTTFSLGPNTTGYFQLLHERTDSGLPGTESSPVLDDQDTFHYLDSEEAIRTPVGDHGFLWLGLLNTDEQDFRTNPNQDASISDNLPAENVVTSQLNSSHASDPELRFDYNLGQKGRTGSILTLGFARPKTDSSLDQNLLNSGTVHHIIIDNYFTALGEGQNYDTLGYLQLRSQPSKRLGLLAQVRQQRVEEDDNVASTLGIFNFGSITNQAKTYTLPSAIATYAVGSSGLIRFQAGRSITDDVEPMLVPISTQITTDANIVPVGLPEVSFGDQDLYEVEADRYGASGRLYKLFLFHTVTRNLSYDFSQYASPNNLFDVPGTLQPFSDDQLFLNRVERTGAGAEYDRQLSHSLFHQFIVEYNHTTDASPGQIYDGQEAPYNPRLTGTYTLNYVNPGGNKANLNFNFQGLLYDDTNLGTETVRPTFPSTVTVDLLLDHAPTVRNEVYFEIHNLFNTRQIIYNGIPVNPRLIDVGIIHRF